MGAHASHHSSSASRESPARDLETRANAAASAHFETLLHSCTTPPPFASPQRSAFHSTDESTLKEAVIPANLLLDYLRGPFLMRERLVCALVALSGLQDHTLREKSKEGAHAVKAEAQPAYRYPQMRHRAVSPRPESAEAETSGVMASKRLGPTATATATTSTRVTHFTQDGPGTWTDSLAPFSPAAAGLSKDGRGSTGHVLCAAENELNPLPPATVSRRAFLMGYRALATRSPQGTAELLFAMLDIAGEGYVKRSELSALLLACGADTLRRAAGLTQTVLPSESPLDLLLTGIFKFARGKGRGHSGSTEPLAGPGRLGSSSSNISDDGSSTGPGANQPAPPLSSWTEAPGQSRTQPRTSAAKDGTDSDGVRLAHLSPEDLEAWVVHRPDVVQTLLSCISLPPVQHRGEGAADERARLNRYKAAEQPAPTSSFAFSADHEGTARAIHCEHSRSRSYHEPPQAKQVGSPHENPEQTSRRVSLDVPVAFLQPGHHAPARPRSVSPHRRRTAVTQALASPVRLLRNSLRRRTLVDAPSKDHPISGFTPALSSPELYSASSPSPLPAPSQAQVTARSAYTLATVSPQHLRWVQPRLKAYEPDPSVDVPENPPCPGARYGHAVCALGNGRWLLFGGCTPRTSDEVWVYDARLRSWTCQPRGPSAPPTSAYHTAVASPTHCFIFGGYTSFVRGYIWEQDLATEQWRQIVPRTPRPDLTSARPAHNRWPLSRFGHTAVYLPGDAGMWVFGGIIHQDATTTAELWRYCPASETWSHVVPLDGADEPWPGPRAFHCMTVLDSHTLLVVGGERQSTFSGEPQLYSDTWTFNVSSRRWAQVTDGPGDGLPSISRACAFALAGKGAADEVDGKQGGVALGRLSLSEDAARRACHADGILLMGGQGDSRVGDAWWLPHDLTGWREIRLASPAPAAALFNASGAAAPLGEAGGALLFGGELGSSGGQLTGALWHLHGGGLENVREGGPSRGHTTKIVVQESTKVDRGL